MSGRVIGSERELGKQRRCGDCGQWWPDDNEFFIVWAHWKSPRCRACHKERGQRRRRLPHTQTHECATCPVVIPAERMHCYFCTGTVALREAASAA